MPVISLSSEIEFAFAILLLSSISRSNVATEPPSVVPVIVKVLDALAKPSETSTIKERLAPSDRLLLSVIRPLDLLMEAD